MVPLIVVLNIVVCSIMMFGILHCSSRPDNTPLGVWKNNNNDSTATPKADVNLKMLDNSCSTPEIQEEAPCNRVVCQYLMNLLEESEKDIQEIYKRLDVENSYENPNEFWKEPEVPVNQDKALEIASDVYDMSNLEDRQTC